MVLEDHYGVLGITPGASVEEVKKAYRSLSRVHHPDKAANIDDAARRDCERRMVALNIAYQVLMSPRQRDAYDMKRAPAPQPQPQQHPRADDTSSHPSFAAFVRASRARAPFAPGCAVPTHRPQPRPRSSTACGRRDSGNGGSDCCGRGSGSARVSSDGSAGSWPRGPVPGLRPKPRYQLGAKYTQRSRQARRMDPSMYTEHIDGRAAEFARPPGIVPPCAPGAEAFKGSSRVEEDVDEAVAAAASRSSAKPTMPPIPVPRTATWLQRQMDAAHAWEQAHCPEPEAEAYQWRKACDGWLKGMKERRQQQNCYERPGDATRDADDAEEWSPDRKHAEGVEARTGY